MQRTSRKKSSGCGRLILYFVVAVVVIGLGAFLYFKNYYDSSLDYTSGNGDVVRVDIPTGSSTDEIAAILKEKDLINDVNVFKLYLRQSGAAGALKAGEYEFFNNQDMTQIVSELVKGAKEIGVKVTFIAGLRYDEITPIIAARFAASENTKVTNAALLQIAEKPDGVEFSADVEEFLSEVKPAGKNLEGFLFPDTYEFKKDVDAVAVIDTILKNFMRKMGDLKPANKLSFYQNLILASIVEKEALDTPGERDEVAGIFLRRYRAGTTLGSDVTVHYIIKDWKRPLTVKDLALDSPFNTRKFPGLTPTPISSPGLKVVQQTAAADESEYFFFLHDKEGKPHYAKTLAEHEENKRKYL